MDNSQKAILVSRIEPYMEKFTKFFKLGHIRLSEAESKEIASMMRELNPRYSVNYKLNCNSCIRDAITALSNFYSRERSKVEFPVTVQSKVEEDLVAFNAKIAEQLDDVIQSMKEEPKSTEVVKDEAYYNSLDKRSKEYRDWKASQTS